MKLAAQFLVIPFLISCAPLQSSSSSPKIIGGTIVNGNPEQRGEYSSAIGIVKAGSGTKCMATRIADNTFLSAAHCMNKWQEGSVTNIVASNTRLIKAVVTNIKIATGFNEKDTATLDLASFSIAFYTIDQKTLFDKFVSIANVRNDIILNERAVIAGFGCESAVEVGSIGGCLTEGSISRFKIAGSSIRDVPSTGNDFYFDLHGLDLANGLIGTGDSGGPVYDSNQQLIGVNQGSSGVVLGTTGAGKSQHVWLGHEASKKFIASIVAPPSNFYVGKTDGFYEYQFDKNGIPFGGTKDTYDGSVSGGMRNGDGKMISANGRTYVGPWLDDAKQGIGETFFEEAHPTSKYFKGMHIKGVPNGAGYLIYKSGDSYEGNFTKGSEDGENGKQTFTNGNYETGKWVMGKREGRFILVRGGTSYTVEYQSDKRVGEPVPL